MSSLKIGEGSIFHSRMTDRENKFTYKTFFLHFNVDDEHALQLLLRGKFKSLFSIRGEDYLDGKTYSLAQGIREFLRNRLGYEAEEIWLQTMPRMLGYGFNPINFWILKRGGKPDAMLCEVNNTFGERHFYWIHPSGELEKQWHRAEKVFHVSPFQPTTGFYEFRFQFSEGKSSIDIVYRGVDNQIRLVTWVKGDLAAADSASPWGLVLRYGWMTPLVIFRIHYQALKLFFKKVPFVSKPKPPPEEITQ
jgi:DUF1365 family protein